MKTNLFNEKTIQKNIAKIEPTAKQKSASKKWIELLEKNQLQEEVANYPRFTELILNQLLEYDILNFKHEEKNMEFPFKDRSGNFLVCFEAKGAKTKDLWALQGRSIKIRETPVNQINDYLYKNKIPYGVLTNYREFVLFKREEGYNKYHKIDFLDIKKNPDKLKEFIFIFSKEGFEKEDITKLYQDSIVEERNLTKEFYKLYHETRLMLLKEFKESELENEVCLHYSQLFLNRLMFIFFAEDTELLDRRYFESKILEILDKSSGVIDGHTDYVFGKIRSMFRELDKEIPKQIKGFNGELFKEEIDGRLSFKDYRNNLFFKDVKQNYKLDKDIELYEDDRKIFNKHKNRLSKIIENILIMASFDFKSEVNVNVLGHIFEQSISDIENLKEEKISKRKREGVFYTPEYVTEYICRNTIIPHLSKSGTNDINGLIDEYSGDIEELEKKFKSIKILDPACGSGAFLIKSTEILFEIFEKIQFVKENYGEYEASRGLKKKSNFEGQLTFKKWDEKDEIKNIIENNIHGVDINEESVEITKLALFLKIARKNKKLIDLSNNIKQGNSLVDDKEVDKRAFDWEKEFPFKFDIVIGNPPYGAKLSEEEVNFVKKEYSVGNSETAQLMMEKAYSLLNEKGYHGFIIPKAFTFVSTWDKIRNKFLDELKIVIDCKKVWKEVKLEQIIYIIQKGNKFDKYYSGIRENETIKIIANVNKSLIPKFDGVLLNSLTNKEIEIGSKIKKINTRLKDLGKDARGDLFYKQINLDKKGFKVLGGNEIQRYYRRGIKGYIDDKYIKTDQSLIKSNSILLQRLIAHIENPTDHLKIAGTILEDSKYKIVDTVYQITLYKEVSNKYVLAVINSNFMNWFVYRFVFAKAIRSFQFSGDVAKKIPIPKISLEEQTPFIEKADLMLKLNKEFYETKNKFIKLIKYKFNLNKISRKLESFYNLNFKEFVNEIQNKNKVMGIEQEAELMEFFEKNKKQVLNLVNEISKTEREIDGMVYKLYGITKEEREVIEKS